MNATVIIPTYNRARKLRLLLQSLTRQRGSALARVVVCDDGSSDETYAVAQHFRTRLPLVYRFQEDQGFRAAQARNMGIEAAVGDIVIFVDDDVLVRPDFVAQHVETHAASACPAIVIGFFKRTKQIPPEEDDDLDWSATCTSSADERIRALGPDGAGLADHPAPYFFVYASNFSLRAASARERFDNRFVGWGTEDVELGYRLVQAGHHVRIAHGAQVLHLDDPCPRDPSEREASGLLPNYHSYLRNCVYFMDKYPHDAVLEKCIRERLASFAFDSAAGRWIHTLANNDPQPLIDCFRAVCTIP